MTESNWKRENITQKCKAMITNIEEKTMKAFIQQRGDENILNQPWMLAYCCQGHHRL